MGVLSHRVGLCAGVALSVLVPALTAGGSAKADAADDAKIKALQIQIEQLTQAVKKLAAEQEISSAKATSAKDDARQAKAQVAQAKATSAQASADGWGHSFLDRKPGKPLTLYTRGGEITAYGNFDVSADYTTKDAKSLNLNGNSPPVGNFGWMPALSTNNSYLGVRGFQHIGHQDFDFVYQLEVGFDITAVPGLKQTNSNLSDTVNGSLFNRNTYIGVASPFWGAIKVGKSDAPYKNSTAEFNPFSGMIGDYSVIMGNSGGDNRVEFGTRIDHAIWYESPVFGGGFKFNVLFAPGQNRATNSDNIASGESDCAGGNDPTSGGNTLVSCSDGAFSNAVSTNLSYTNGPLYMTAAYEFHNNVNRQSDISGLYGTAGNLPTVYAQTLFNGDVSNEDAAKIGIMYHFPTDTTVGVIGERLHRYTSSMLDFQNERSRYGTWLVVSQKLNEEESLHFGWAHAFRAVGDPGQHNDATLTTLDGLANYAPNQNQADMLTAAYLRKLDENLTWYADVAATLNGPSAHYDLGAGGRGVTTDCHDASDASGGALSNPHCFTGTTLLGVSTGLRYRF